MALREIEADRHLYPPVATIENCEMEFVCPIRWDQLQAAQLDVDNAEVPSVADTTKKYCEVSDLQPSSTHTTQSH